jgi:hypothetical protein
MKAAGLLAAGVELSTLPELLTSTGRNAPTL